MLEAWWADLEGFVVPGGESLGQLRRRVLRALGKLLARHPGETVCLVAHGGVNRVILLEALATPLDLLKQNNALLVEDLWTQNPQFGRWAGIGWEWANIAFLAGGAWLLYQRIFTWHAPVAMLASLSLLAALFYDGGSSASGGSPLFHLLSGATMFGAFFIVTDPVTSAASLRGRLIYGALVGALVYIIRVRGNYPDAVAFAVLLMNFAAPFIDHYTQPRTYGHQGTRGEE